MQRVTLIAMLESLIAIVWLEKPLPQERLLQEKRPQEKRPQKKWLKEKRPQKKRLKEKRLKESGCGDGVETAGEAASEAAFR